MDEIKINLDEMIKQAEGGDTEAVKLLSELEQRRQEEELRKDLFGV